MSDKSRKLLFVVTEDWYFVSHRLSLAVAAKESGFDVAVATRFSIHEEQLVQAGLSPLMFELPRRSLSPLTLANAIWRLYRLYRIERPDIVHHVSLVPVVLGSVAARLAGVKTVNAVTGMGWLFIGNKKRLTRLVSRVLRALPANSRVIVQNPDDRDLLLRMGVAKRILRLIPGAGVDTEKFFPIAEPHGTPVVMLASRLLWDKGVGEFVKAAQQLQSEDIAARFVLVGDPDNDNPATVPEPLIHQWVADGVIEWWGRRTDMPQVLNSAHIVCLPSYREGLPKVLLEAAACGRPIITTDVPGCREVVKEGINGILIPIRDSSALASAIRLLIQDNNLRLQMGIQGRERAKNEFSVETIVNETLSIYQELL